MQIAVIFSVLYSVMSCSVKSFNGLFIFILYHNIFIFNMKLKKTPFIYFSLQISSCLLLNYYKKMDFIRFVLKIIFGWVNIKL